MSTSEYDIQWKPSAEKELRRLPREAVIRIRGAVEGLRINPFPVGVRKLVSAEHQYRIREGSYRVIHTVDGGRLVVEIIRVRHRRDVYR